MWKGLVALTLGEAAVGLFRFFATAIAEEHRRRGAVHEEHEATRWEGEGGNVVPSYTGTSGV